MKQVILPGLMALAFVSLDAAAQCQGSTRIADLTTLLPGNTVCATRGSDRWQEQHRGSGTSGQLWDYKKGADDPIDPSKQVGTWSISQQGQDYRRITYTYNAFGAPVSHTFEVHTNGNGTYNFCGVGAAQTVTGATLRNGAVPCN